MGIKSFFLLSSIIFHIAIDLFLLFVMVIFYPLFICAFVHLFIVHCFLYVFLSFICHCCHCCCLKIECRFWHMCHYHCNCFRPSSEKCVFGRSSKSVSQQTLKDSVLQCSALSSTKNGFSHI